MIFLNSIDIFAFGYMIKMGGKFTSNIYLISWARRKNYSKIKTLKTLRRLEHWLMYIYKISKTPSMRILRRLLKYWQNVLQWRSNSNKTKKMLRTFIIKWWKEENKWISFCNRLKVKWELHWKESKLIDVHLSLYSPSAYS